MTDIALKLADQRSDFERQKDVDERAFEDTGQIHLQLRDELREGCSRGEALYRRDLLNCGLRFFSTKPHEENTKKRPDFIADPCDSSYAFVEEKKRRSCMFGV